MWLCRFYKKLIKKTRISVLDRGRFGEREQTVASVGGRPVAWKGGSRRHASRSRATDGGNHPPAPLHSLPSPDSGINCLHLGHLDRLDHLSHLNHLSLKKKRSSLSAPSPSNALTWWFEISNAPHLRNQNIEHLCLTFFFFVLFHVILLLITELTTSHCYISVFLTYNCHDQLTRSLLLSSY